MYRILFFYEKAKHEKEETIWKRWAEEYGFAAVPTEEEGRHIARQMLKEVWEQYEDCIEEIKQFDPGKIQMEQALEDVKELMRYASPVPSKVHFFIGLFEENPFVAPLEGGEAALVWPVEVELSEVIRCHELASVQKGWGERL